MSMIFKVYFIKTIEWHTKLFKSNGLLSSRLCNVAASRTLLIKSPSDSKLVEFYLIYLRVLTVIFTIR